MKTLLVIAAGGAAGSVMRYLVSTGVHRLSGEGFPWGTLSVNLLGSLLMGGLWVWLVERSAAAPEFRSMLLIGFLGAFTTFSTFSLETLNLLESGAIGRGLANMVVSVTGCVLAAWLGILLGRQL